MPSPVSGTGSYLGKIEGTTWDADNVVRTDQLTDWQFGTVIPELEGLGQGCSRKEQNGAASGRRRCRWV